VELRWKDLGEFVRRERQTRLARTANGGLSVSLSSFFRDEQIALLYFFDKNEKEDLTKADKKIFLARM